MKKVFNHKMTLFSLMLVIFIDSLTIGLVLPLFAVLFNDPHGILPPEATIATRNLLYALIISLPMFALFFGSPILGELSDRWGRKLVLLISLMGVFLSCLLSVLSFYMSSVLVLFISRILVALMDGSQSIAQAAIVDISYPEEKVKNLSMITLSATLGWAIGPIVGGVLSDPNVVSWFNYKLPFWLSAGFALLNFILLQFTFKETSAPPRHEQHSFATIFINLSKSFIDKRYVILAFPFMLMQFGWSVFFQAVNLLLAQNFHYSSAGLGLYATYMALLFSILLMLIMKFLLPHFRSLNVARAGLLVLSIGLAGMVFLSHDVLAIWLLLIPCVLGMAMSYNTILGLFSNSVSEREQGRVMGVSLGLVALSWLFAGFFTGHMTSVSYPITFAVDSMAVALGFIFLLRYREQKREHHEHIS